jgi:hypothetical protein
MKRYCLQKNIVPSQGIHLVLTNHSYLVIALMIQKQVTEGFICGAMA